MTRTATEHDEARTGLVVRLTDGREWPLVVGPAMLREITGDRRSEHSLRNDCAAGLVPTLPRGSGSGAHHRIPTAKLLEQLGVPFEVVPARSA